MIDIRLEDLKFCDQIFINDEVEIKSAIVKQNHFKVCVKTLKVKKIKKLNKSIEESVSISKFSHPNVYKFYCLKILGDANKFTGIALMTEYLENGNLSKFIGARIDSGNKWSEETLFYYASQLVSAFSFMQEHEFAHRDIKPENILVTAGGKKLKIADFGYTCKVIKKSMSLRGTENYLSPVLRDAFMRGQGEEIKSLNHNAYKSDVFSLGLILLYMASFKNPTKFKKLSKLNDKIQRCIDKVIGNYPNFAEYLRCLLQFEEDNRPDFILLKEAMGQTRQFSKSEYCIYCQNYLVNAHLTIIYDNLYCQPCVIKVQSSKHKCLMCNEVKPFQDVYIFNTKTYCKVCLDLNTIQKQPLYCSLCSTDINEDYTCKCKNFTRCKVCKIFNHARKNCIENSSSFYNFGSEALLKCSCNTPHAKTKNIYFYVCGNQNKYYCWVCGLSLDDDHSKCIILLRFSQYLDL